MTRSSASQPDPVQVRAALQRLLQSSFIPDGSLLARMLAHVVERTLEGEARSIKAYTIAVEAFGRPTDFDPDRDSTVRVAAMRLRAALDLYYSGPGAGDPVRIRLVPGSYRPVFETVGAAAAAPPSGLIPARMPPTRVWLATVSAVVAVNLVLTLSLMAVQLRGQAVPAAQADIPAMAHRTPVPAAEKPAGARSHALYDLVQHQVQASFGQRPE